MFPAYLRGMETFFGQLKRNFLHGFPAYLRGMETGKIKSFLVSPYTFPAYLRGMETNLVIAVPDPGERVPSLPKRNGNFLKFLQPHVLHLRSQPT